MLLMTSKTPLKRLKHHINLVYQSVEQLTIFFTQTFNNDWQQARAIGNQIIELEHQADHLKRQARLESNPNQMAFFSRRQLISLIDMQDGIINEVKDIVGIVQGRRLQMPVAMRNDFIAYIQSCNRACEQTKAIIYRLLTLERGLFSRKLKTSIRQMIHELGDVEQRSDDVQRNLQQTLIELEDSLKSIEVWFIYDIIRRIGFLADHAERIGQDILLSSV